MKLSKNFRGKCNAVTLPCAHSQSKLPRKVLKTKVYLIYSITYTDFSPNSALFVYSDLRHLHVNVHEILFTVSHYYINNLFGSRYLKKHIWTDFFAKFLNIKDLHHLPDLLDFKEKIDDEVYNMESELQSQIRTLSNILHKR